MSAQVKGVDEVNRRINATLNRVGGRMTERFITEFIIVVAGYASAMTPIATGTLINSQFRRVYATPTGVAGEVGYGARYAIYVHDAPGSLMGTETPRHPRRLGKVWGPNAQPGFLAEGLQQAVTNDLDTLLRRHYRL